MSLSPRGSSVVGVGQPVKAWLIMLVGGVLAWITGQSWSIERDAGEIFQLVMAFGTLAVVAVPAQLVGGRTCRPWLLAAAGTTGLIVPWFFALAITQQGQGVFGTTLVLMAAAYAMTYVVSWLTRAGAARWAEI
ncbi:hypothetical protein [Ornithinimicrobium cerasi]|uniref:hypothetical protein n=1 Tax=Ornithinimicrobium cerasi TaxID=2248773 RepID=UPI000F000FC5|nr:hypothetical protein [Ornithinimicrobium cerasi]